MKPVALVLGGTHDHIALIRKLKDRGYKTILVDYLENPPAKQVADEHLQISTLDPQEVLGVAQSHDAKIVIAASIDQALLTMAYVCEQLRLPCHISYETAQALTNKAIMKQKFAKNKIPTTAYTVITKPEHAKDIQLEYPLVVKPADSNSSKGIVRVEVESEILDAVTQALSMSRVGEVVAEEYFEGEELSVDVIVRSSQAEVILITQTLKNFYNSRNFTITQSTYEPDKNTILKNHILDIAQKIADSYRITNGPMLIQVLHNNGELRVIEFSARIGGGSKYALIKKLTGFDIQEYFLDVLLGNPSDQVIQSVDFYASLFYVYAKKGRIAKLDGFGQLITDSIADEVFYYQGPGAIIKENRSSSDRIAGILVTAKNARVLKEKINAANTSVAVIDTTGDDIKVDSVKGFHSASN